jgi:hypothetical protein
MGWKLKRLRQCEKCPWKVSTNPHDIPNGYSADLHRSLAGTIADPNHIPRPGETLRNFACHEHPVGEEVECVGWLMNQIGTGNNIALRLKMLSCENAHLIQLDGPQHKRFEDTLPKTGPARMPETLSKDETN